MFTEKTRAEGVKYRNCNSDHTLRTVGARLRKNSCRIQGSPSTAQIPFRAPSCRSSPYFYGVSRGGVAIASGDQPQLHVLRLDPRQQRPQRDSTPPPSAFRLPDRGHATCGSELWPQLCHMNHSQERYPRQPFRPMAMQAGSRWSRRVETLQADLCSGPILCILEIRSFFAHSSI